MREKRQFLLSDEKKIHARVVVVVVVERRRRRRRQRRRRRASTSTITTTNNNKRMVLLSIKPRLQKEKWSLYWKCSMATRTMYLDEFDLDVDIAKTTARELKKMIAERVGLPPVAELFRLEGFQEPWELMCAQLVVGSLFLFRWFFTSFVRSLRYFVRFFPRTDKLFLSFL